MSYLPYVDTAACAAHGDCVAVAPQVFALEDLAVVVGEGPDDLIVEAARACPSGAIIVIDAESGDEVPL